MRAFTDAPAVRERVPLLIGLVGPSGSGKTYSALRLATGIQRESGGLIFGIDTEARRMAHYSPKPGEVARPEAGTFAFQHVEFKAPFGPLDYLAAIEHCRAKGAKVIVIDSMSHEHEGSGGVLDQHETELDRLTSRVTDPDLKDKKRDAVNFLAWAKPKGERRRLLNSIVQMNLDLIFCFRAKEKIKLVKIQGKTEPVALGWQAIAGDEFVYELTTSLLLPPASGGVPLLNPAIEGERVLVKIPSYFTSLIAAGKPLDEDLGQKLARWAAGDSTKPAAGAGLLDQIGALLAGLPTQEAKKAALPAAFGVPTWKQVQALPREKLEHGLALLQRARQESDDQAEAHRQAMAQNEQAAGVPRGISPQEPPSEGAAQGRLL
jgi:hypothetical protein